MKDKKRNKDYKEKRPAIETNGMNFNETLKRLAKTGPKEVEKIEKRATKWR